LATRNTPVVLTWSNNVAKRNKNQANCKSVCEAARRLKYLFINNILQIFLGLFVRIEGAKPDEIGIFPALCRQISLLAK
jgi:hypothetical protein